MAWRGEPGRSPRPAAIPGHGGGRGGRGLRREGTRETAPAPGGTREAGTAPPPPPSPHTHTHNTTHPPHPTPPGTPEQTLQRFISTEQRSAASKLLLRAGQEKWVFNRQGRRAWQPATAAGEINKQRSCDFRSEQKLRSRARGARRTVRGASTEEPPRRAAPDTPPRTPNLAPLRGPGTGSPAPRGPGTGAGGGGGEAAALRYRARCRRAGSGRGGQLAALLYRSPAVPLA